MAQFLHAGMSKGDAEAALMPNKASALNGRFLFRSTSATDVVISVVFKGKVTHHSLQGGEVSPPCICAPSLRLVMPNSSVSSFHLPVGLQPFSRLEF
jgi:hypothetical protein